MQCYFPRTMERAIVSARAKREYVETIYQRYRRAKRAEKRQILDEFCHVAASSQGRQSAAHRPRARGGAAPAAPGPPLHRRGHWRRWARDARPAASLRRPVRSGGPVRDGAPRGRADAVTHDPPRCPDLQRAAPTGGRPPPHASTSRRRPATPAMEAGITDHVQDLAESFC